MSELGVEPEAILLTHTHIDHIGAVAPIARATGVPVYCPRAELTILAHPDRFFPPAWGSVEPWEAEQPLDGGERLQLAGLDIDVVSTPGHSPGHVTYAIDGALFSGDVLFENSIGRTDLPGADHATLMASIAALLERFDDDTDGPPRSHGAHHARRASGRRTPSCRRSRAGEREAPGAARHVRRAARQAAARASLEDAARRILEPAGYGRIETPTFEATELFARGVGESTDIVQKEMYTFQDAGGRSLTLRPEGTAPVCRAYLEHGMHTLAQPVKLWYLGSYYRQEKPQAGRFRQFWQLGAEAIGSDDPAVDAELDRAAAHAAGRARGPRACACAWARWAASTRAPSTASA